jgi:hypothetical protein
MKRLIPGVLAFVALLSLTAGLLWGQPPITPNNIRLRGAALGANPTILTEGLDTNISGTFATQGTGTWLFQDALTINPGSLTITQGAITAAAPNLSGTVTWNNVAVTFTGWLLNVTDTTSAAGSLLADLQIGGVSRFNVGKNGNATLANGGNANVSPLTLTGGTLTTSNPLVTGTQTWNAGGVTFTGLFANITDTASAAGSLLADLQIGGASRFSVGKNGNATLANGGNANVSPLTLTGGTVTTSNPLLTGTQVWNAAGVVFDAHTISITNTASAAGSRFLSLQRGATLQFGVTSGATSTGLRLRTAQQSVPTCANCGATGTVAGTDAAGVITIAGAGPASPITVTFSGTYETTPACTAANHTTAVNYITRVAPTTTNVAIYFAAGPGAADSISYVCLGTS